MKCESCGAPLEAGMERCPYCGTLVPVDESKLEEKLKLKHEQERRKKLEGLAQMKYVSGAFLVVLYIFTLGLYSVYWYAMRMKDINKLNENNAVKLPAWGVAVFALSYCGALIISELEETLGLAPEQSQEIFNILIGIAIVVSIWLAFRVRDILQSYAANYIEKAVAVRTVAPSSVMLILFGAAYLQSQVNKMISMEILAPKI